MKSLKKFFLFIVLCQCWLGFSTVAQAEVSHHWEYLRVKKNFRGAETWVFQIANYDHKFAKPLPAAPVNDYGVPLHKVFKIKELFLTSGPPFVMIGLAGPRGENLRWLERVNAVCNGKPQTHRTMQETWNGYSWSTTEYPREIEYKCLPMALAVDDDSMHGGLAHVYCDGGGIEDEGARIGAVCVLARPPVRRALAALCDTAAQKATPGCIAIQTQLNLWNKAHPSSGLPGNDAPR
jgi:hypothetical protein